MKKISLLYLFLVDLLVRVVPQGTEVEFLLFLLVVLWIKDSNNSNVGQDKHNKDSTSH